MKITDYTNVTKFGEVTNASPTLILLPAPITTPDTEKNVYLRSIHISIHLAATGGGGLLELQNTAGTILQKWDADTIKEISMSHGNGIFIVTSGGVQLVATGAATAQASASISWTGFISTKKLSI